jgi:serine phosphatase RsbU (regulator of sigma subunit)
MHGLLEECLPEGIYVEGTLARLRPNGEVTVAPAGGTRLLLRSGGASQVAWHKLKGSWLGLIPPGADDQRIWTLAAEDELVLGSDGLFDQIADYGGPGDPLADLFAGSRDSLTLFDAVHQVLQEALQKQPQKDDITMLMLRRHDQLSVGSPDVSM